MPARSLELKIPPPVVAVIFGVFMWVVSKGMGGWEISLPIRSVVALLLVAIGVAFSAAGIVQFRQCKTTVNPIKPETASALVSSGVFNVTRNPMYVGLALVLVAWAVFLASPWTLMGPLAFGLYIDRFQIAPEERALSKLFGAEYSTYKARIRRWL